MLSKNRTEDARKSLQWLRGWVSPKAVEKEFAEVQRYSEFSKACSDCVKLNEKCPHPPPTALQKLKELTRKRTLKPFTVMLVVYFFTHFSGMHAMRPYIVLVLKAYGTPISANYATVVLGLTGILGTTICVVTVKFFGKRRLYLISLACVGVMATFLSKLNTFSPFSFLSLVFQSYEFLSGVYGYMKLPAGWTSFNPQTDTNTQIEGSFFPMIIIVSMNLFTAMGAGPVPSMLLSEVFPFK